MKMDKKFIDCVYENSELSQIKYELVRRLPDKGICDRASILAIDTNNGVYVVKIRDCYLKDNGDIDIEKTHNKIRESNFIEISEKDYSNMHDWNDIFKRTSDLIKIGSNNVIYRMNIDVDALVRHIKEYS